MFTTARLLARRWRMEDAAAMLAMYSDPEVTRYIGGRTVPDLEHQRRDLARYIGDYEKYDGRLGGWALEERTTGAVVGSILLNPLPDAEGHRDPSGAIQVGWHLARTVWGKGYATEAGIAALSVGFERLGLLDIFAVIEPENHRSMRVVERIGMEYLGRQRRFYSGIELEVFKMTRAQWRTYQEISSLKPST